MLHVKKAIANEFTLIFNRDDRYNISNKRNLRSENRREAHFGTNLA